MQQRTAGRHRGNPNTFAGAKPYERLIKRIGQAFCYAAILELHGKLS